MKALITVHAHQATATGANPFSLLRTDEFPNPVIPDVVKILDHTHSVLGSVSLIELPQPFTGIALTIETIRIAAARWLRAVLDSADDAMVRFVLIAPLTAATRLSFSLEANAKRTVHSAQCDKFC